MVFLSRSTSTSSSFLSLWIALSTEEEMLVVSGWKMTDLKIFKP